MRLPLTPDPLSAYGEREDPAASGSTSLEEGEGRITALVNVFVGKKIIDAQPGPEKHDSVPSYSGD